MADLTTGLYGYLASIVPAGTAVYSTTIPGSARLPYVVYHVLSTVPHHTLDGYTGTTRTTLQIDCWGDTYVDLAETLRQHLDGYSGHWGDVEVQGCFRVNQFTLPELAGDASDVWIRRYCTQWDVHHRESVPTF